MKEINSAVGQTATQFRVVFPGDLNPSGTLFGGVAMQWLDETAFIVATRCARQRMVTVKIGQVRFLRPVHADSILEITARIVRAGFVKLEISVEAWAEDLYSQRRERVIEAEFTFAACNTDLKPSLLTKGNPDKAAL